MWHNIYTRYISDGFKKTEGFSLAEVIVCLAIVGIIAAMVIPVMVFDVYEKTTVVKLVKFYSTISNAYKMVRSVYGPPEDWPDHPFNSKKANKALFVEKFKPFLKIMHDCEVENSSLCLMNNQYYKIDGSIEMNLVNRYDLVLADGSSVLFYTRNDGAQHSRTKSYGYIYIDINGVNGPNRAGYDLFEFAIMNDYIVPGYLDVDGSDSYLLRNCLNNGYSCAAWVILHQNIIYRKCPDDLIIFGRTSCY